MKHKLKIRAKRRQKQDINIAFEPRPVKFKKYDLKIKDKNDEKYRKRRLYIYGHGEAFPLTKKDILIDEPQLTSKQFRIEKGYGKIMKTSLKGRSLYDKVEYPKEKLYKLPVDVFSETKEEMQENNPDLTDKMFRKQVRRGEIEKMDYKGRSLTGKERTELFSGKRPSIRSPLQSPLLSIEEKQKLGDYHKESNLIWKKEDDLYRSYVKENRERHDRGEPFSREIGERYKREKEINFKRFEDLNKRYRKRVYEQKDTSKHGDNIMLNLTKRVQNGFSVPEFKGGGKIHPGFKKVQLNIARKQGISVKNAGAILASSTRKASPEAKRKNPRLLKVKGLAHGGTTPRTQEEGFTRLSSDVKASGFAGKLGFSEKGIGKVAGVSETGEPTKFGKVMDIGAGLAVAAGPMGVAFGTGTFAARSRITKKQFEGTDVGKIAEADLPARRQRGLAGLKIGMTVAGAAGGAILGDPKLGAKVGAGTGELAGMGAKALETEFGEDKDLTPEERLKLEKKLGRPLELNLGGHVRKSASKRKKSSSLYATGGIIKGPGTSTSDSILMRANGGFIVREKFSDLALKVRNKFLDKKKNKIADIKGKKGKLIAVSDGEIRFTKPEDEFLKRKLNIDLNSVNKGIPPQAVKFGGRIKGYAKGGRDEEDRSGIIKGMTDEQIKKLSSYEYKKLMEKINLRLYEVAIKRSGAKGTIDTTVYKDEYLKLIKLRSSMNRIQNIEVNKKIFELEQKRKESVKKGLAEAITITLDKPKKKESSLLKFNANIVKKQIGVDSITKNIPSLTSEVQQDISMKRKRESNNLKVKIQSKLQLIAKNEGKGIKVNKYHYNELNNLLTDYAVIATTVELNELKDFITEKGKQVGEAIGGAAVVVYDKTLETYGKAIELPKEAKMGILNKVFGIEGAKQIKEETQKTQKVLDTEAWNRVVQEGVKASKGKTDQQMVEAFKKREFERKKEEFYPSALVKKPKGITQTEFEKLRKERLLLKGKKMPSLSELESVRPPPRQPEPVSAKLFEEEPLTKAQIAASKLRKTAYIAEDIGRKAAPGVKKGFGAIGGVGGILGAAQAAIAFQELKKMEERPSRAISKEALRTEADAYEASKFGVGVLETAADKRDADVMRRTETQILASRSQGGQELVSRLGASFARQAEEGIKRRALSVGVQRQKEQISQRLTLGLEPIRQDIKKDPQRPWDVKQLALGQLGQAGIANLFGSIKAREYNRALVLASQTGSTSNLVEEAKKKQREQAGTS